MNSIMSLIWALAITILVLYFSFLFTRKLGNGIGIKGGRTCMQMLDRLPLGQDKAVAIIRVGSRYYLIGIASSQITLLAELSQEEIPFGSSSIAFGEDGGGKFRDILHKYTNRHKKDEEE